MKINLHSRNFLKKKKKKKKVQLVTPLIFEEHLQKDVKMDAGEKVPEKVGP